MLFSKTLFLSRSSKKELKDIATSNKLQVDNKNQLNVMNQDEVRNEESDDDNESVFCEGVAFKKDSVFKKFCDITKEPVFIFTCIAITTFLFISTAIIFWGTDYLINVLHGETDTVLEIFVFVSITGPVIGIIAGGAIVQKYAGGYEAKSSIIFAMLFLLLAFAAALPFRYMDSVYGFSACLWGIMFFGGAAIPILQGIMISSLKNDLRAAGNSVSNILQNLLGFLPAPVVYGFIYEKTKKIDPKAAMTCVLFYSIVGIGFACVSYFYRNIKKTSKLIEEEIHFEQNDNKNENKFHFDKVSY